MEYKKDTRTKNLTLRDIHVGDWVQVWSEQAERYSPPLKIIQICDDGTIYLVTSDEERCTPWEEDIKNVDALPITPELLKGFGFKENPSQPYFIEYPEYHLIYHWGSIVLKKGKCTILCEGEHFHELQQFLDSIGEPSDFIWQGI